MDQRALVVMLVVGAIAGWLAGIVVGHPKWGIVGSILAGIIGGVVGGALLNAGGIKLNLGHPIANAVATGFIGAILVIVLARILS